MFKKENLSFLFLALTEFFCVINGNLTSFQQAELIKALSEYFDCYSVILTARKSDAFNKNIRLGKYLKDPVQFYTGFWNFKTFTRNMFSDEVFIPPRALVVVENNPLNLKELSWVSRKISIAPYHWLILSASASEIDSDFKDFSIPINCPFIVSTIQENNMVVLYELYQVSKHSNLIIKRFGMWSFEKGLFGLRGVILNERIDFKGHQFNFAVHNISNSIDPCMTTTVDNGKQTIQCAYFNVWKNLEHVFNFTTEYVVIEDCYQNGTMGLSTPMLEMIRTGGADTGDDGYVWSSSRLKHHKFLWPLFHTKIILVTKIPSRKISFSSYVRPFATSMWFALIGWLMVSGLIVHLTKFLARKMICGGTFSGRNEYIENSFVPFTAVCYQSSSMIPTEAAIRLTYLMIYLIPVVFIPSYSGSVISSLSFPPINIPFSNLNEFEKDGTYEISAVNNTFFQFFLMTDDKFEVVRQKKLVSKTLTMSYEQGFRDLCSKKVTFIFEWPLMSKCTINCNIFKFDLSLTKIFSSMAVRKNFPYLELFNRQMQKLINSGLNMKMLERVTMEFFKYEMNQFSQNYFQIKPFGLVDIIPLLAILIGGIALSIFLLFLEMHFQSGDKKKYLDGLRFNRGNWTKSFWKCFTISRHFLSYRGRRK